MVILILPQFVTFPSIQKQLHVHLYVCYGYFHTYAIYLVHGHVIFDDTNSIHSIKHITDILFVGKTYTVHVHVVQAFLTIHIL